MNRTEVAMQFQIGLATPMFMPVAPPAELGSHTADVLRQILEVQREQTELLRTLVAHHDMGARWRAFLARWQKDFPDLPEACCQALPVLERSYNTLLHELADYLHQDGSNTLDNEFALSEFLDRYGMRLGQLGSVLGLVGFLAEAGEAGD